MASLEGFDDILEIFDAHERSLLCKHLADLCCALASTSLPVLVLLECFGWSAANVGERQQLPLTQQWRIAKHIIDASRQSSD